MVEIKGVVHLKKKTFADNLLTPMSSFLSSVEKKLRFLIKNIPGFSPYNGLQWEPNGSRSKREFQCSFKGLSVYSMDYTDNLHYVDTVLLRILIGV